jgi:hypothetical protein
VYNELMEAIYKFAKVAGSVPAAERLIMRKCEMRKLTWATLAVLPLLATGLLYAKSLVQTNDKPQQISEAG